MLLRLALAIILPAALLASSVQAATPRLSPAKAKQAVKRDWREAYSGAYDIRCRRTSRRSLACTLAKVSGAGPTCARGTAKRTKRGTIAVRTWPLADCTGIPGVKAAPAPAPAQPAPTQPAPQQPAPTPAPPTPTTAASLSGTFVCLTGILGQVRLAGPTEIAPLEIPATLSEPPLKFRLKPDGTYSNITFGEVYATNPQWQGTYKVVGDRVSLFTPPGSLLTSYPFLLRTDAAGTQYLLEDAPATEQYRAYACRRIA